MQAGRAILNVRHLTTYRYKRPVEFGDHRMMMRPRDGHDQRSEEHTSNSSHI